MSFHYNLKGRISSVKFKDGNVYGDWIQIHVTDSNSLAQKAFGFYVLFRSYSWRRFVCDYSSVFSAETCSNNYQEKYVPFS